MEDINTKISLQEEISKWELRLQTLPDSQFEERIEIRKKLIKLYIENGQTVTI
jgi:hypothetical protein